MGVQVISHEGKPEYAVVPWQDYLALLEAAGRPAPATAEPPAPVAAAVTPERPGLDRLAALREAKGLALENLARTVGISPSYLGMIERGERLPDAAIQRSLAWELGVPGWSERS